MTARLYHKQSNLRDEYNKRLKSLIDYLKRDPIILVNWLREMGKSESQIAKRLNMSPTNVWKKYPRSK